MTKQEHWRLKRLYVNLSRLEKSQKRIAERLKKLFVKIGE